MAEMQPRCCVCGRLLIITEEPPFLCDHPINPHPNVPGPFGFVPHVTPSKDETTKTKKK